jgi:DNA-binding transcriptional LysR family regulator
VELRQLRHFLTVAELGSLTLAAGRLDVAQPALSRDIRLLEQEFGTRLFHRNGRGVELTAEGRAFRDAVAGLVRGLDAVRSAWLDRARSVTGTTRLGWTGSISFPIGNVVIAAFTERFPAVEFQARVGSSAQVLDWVRNGDLDIGVMNSERPAIEAGAETLLRTGLFYVAARQDGDPAEDGTPISFRDATGGPLFVHSNQNATGRIVEKVARDLGIRLKIAAEVDDFSTVRPLIATGHAATIIPKSLLGPILPGTAVVCRPIIDPEPVIYFNLHFGRTMRNATVVRTLADIIRDETRRAVRSGLMDGILLC